MTSTPVQTVKSSEPRERLRYQWIKENRRYLVLSVIPLLFVAVLLRRPWAIAHNTHLTILAVGVILIVFGEVIRLIAANEICGRKTSQLVTSGIYSAVRNPLYVGNFVAGIGLCLIAESLTMMAIVVFFYSTLYSFVVLHEEKLLVATHGALYSNYLSEVPRFLPKPAAFLRSIRFPQHFDRRLITREFPNAVGLLAGALLLVWLSGLNATLDLPSIFP